MRLLQIHFVGAAVSRCFCRRPCARSDVAADPRPRLLRTLNRPPITRGTEGSNPLPYSGESGELPAITPGLGATSSTRSSAGLGADRSPSSLGQTKELRARPMRARRQLAFSTLTSLPIAWAGRWIFSFSVSCLTASLTEISYFSGYRSRRLKVKHLRGRLPLEPPRREAGKGSRRPAYEMQHTYACKTGKISQKKTL